MKIPRLGPGERAVNVIGFEVCRTVLGAMGQGRHHPTLVAYGDVETTPYLVMEFIDGVRGSAIGSTACRCRPRKSRGWAPRWRWRCAELHRQDVVHLDLKPTNVVFRPNGEAVLIDFGLAHHGHFPDLLAEELRIPVGNWVYMAPEQVQGVRCDPRSDIFALGAHPLRARDRAAAVRPSGHRRRASPAALPRPGSSARPRPGDAADGCRKSSCAASRSTRATGIPRPARSRSRSRRPRR